MPNVNRAYGEDQGVRPARGRPKVTPEGQAGKSEPNPHHGQGDNHYLRESIEHFITDDMGFLKVRRGLDSEDLHLTWQFCNGEFYGHYVYVRVQWWQIEYGLALLIQKRDEVYSRQRIPTPDKRNPSHK